MVGSWGDIIIRHAAITRVKVNHLMKLGENVYHTYLRLSSLALCETLRAQGKPLVFHIRVTIISLRVTIIGENLQ